MGNQALVPEGWGIATVRCRRWNWRRFGGLYQGAYDVLVTTTIIETGVDILMLIPFCRKMRTIWVYPRSTNYVVSGANQSTMTYAYLMYEPFKSLSEVGEKRLQAVAEFTSWDQALRLPCATLSIRTGNLLGKQQSGFIDSVGFDLYSQM